MAPDTGAREFPVPYGEQAFADSSFSLQHLFRHALNGFLEPFDL